MYDVILIPTDGSAHATHAATTGLELASALDAEVHVICVVDAGPLGELQLPGDAARPGDVLRERADTFVSDLGAKAAELNLDVTTAVISGSPKVEIIDYADEIGAKLIVMGTRGRGGVSRMALGSVTDHVIRFGSCEVLVSRDSGADA